MELSKSNELIKEWRFAVGNKDYSPARDSWMSLVWNEVRDEIEQSGLSDEEEIKNLDQKLIKDTLRYGASVSEDKPLKKWWWHLYEISQKTYPSELLPDYLRKIYQNF